MPQTIMEEEVGREKKSYRIFQRGGTFFSASKFMTQKSVQKKSKGKKNG